MFSVPLLVYVALLAILFGSTQSKNLPKDAKTKLRKRYIEISEGVCDELSALVLQYRDVFRLQIAKAIKKQYEEMGHTPPDYDAKFQEVTGVSITDDSKIKELVCKIAGAETLSDITGLLNLPPFPEEILATQYQGVVSEIQYVVKDIGFDTLRKLLDFKEYMENFAKQSNFVDDSPAHQIINATEELHKIQSHFTVGEAEILLTNLVERFGNDFPKLINMIGGCMPPYCTSSVYIVKENRIGCIADAFVLSQSVSDFATRLGLPDDYAESAIRSIARVFQVVPDGSLHMYRILIDIIELTYEELPGLYNLGDAGDK